MSFNLKKRILFQIVNRNLYICNTNEELINQAGGKIKMENINTNLGVCVTKVKMLRPKSNPKNKKDLVLDVDWGFDYREGDDNVLEYLCTLKTFGEFPVEFAVQGSVELKSKENFEKNSGSLSRLILDKSMNMMVNMINITRDTPLNFETFSGNSVDDDLKIVLKEMI